MGRENILNHRACISCLVVAMWVAAALSAGATTYYVATNGHHQNSFSNWYDAATTIQAAVNASGAGGNTIMISNGMYYGTDAEVVYSARNVINLQRANIVRGFSTNPADVVIDGRWSQGITNRGAFVGSGGTLAYLTISNCCAGDGGGVMMHSSYGAGTVSNCIITCNRSTNLVDAYSGGGGVKLYWIGQILDSTISANVAANSGGGLSIHGGAGVAVKNCAIYDNTSSGMMNNSYRGGGGIYAYDATIISNCTIFHNRAQYGVRAYDGGGLYIERVVRVIDCVISNNLVTGGGIGGGVAAELLTGYMTRCTVVANTNIGGDGGGLYLGAGGTSQSSYTGLVTQCTIRDNVARNGGGVYHFNCLMRSCLITGNTATNKGGGYRSTGVTNSYWRATLENCTIVSNTALVAGGGAYIWDGGFLRNAIIYGNAAPSASNWTVEGASAYSFDNGCTAPLTGLTGTNNIAGPPGFVGAANGNYRLASGSPCIDTGTNVSWMAGDVDLDGKPRLDRWISQVDMGTYEYVKPGTVFTSR